MFGKEDFLKIVRSKAKQPLTEQEENFYTSTWEATEAALNDERVIRDKKIGDITALLGTFDEGETAASVIRRLAKQVDDLENKAKRGLNDDQKYKLRSLLEEKKDDITSAIRAQRSKNPSEAKDWAIEFKAKRAASALMTTSTVLTGATAINTMNVMDDLEVLVIQYPKNFIIDAIGGRQVSNVPTTLRWKEQAAESTSSLGLTSEGATKNITDKAFTWKTADRVKYAGRIEFTEELAMDFDQLLLQIIDMFEQQVIRAWNAGVQAALVAYASDYTSTELDGFFVSPGTSQVIQAGKLWVENRLYQPDLCFIRPGDAALALIQQNKDGDISYIPEAVAFHGLTPFVSTNIPSGKIYIGTSSTVKEQHSNFILRRGVYGNQFIENEETIVGEVFSLLKLPTISQASWLELDITTIKSALTKTVG